MHPPKIHPPSRRFGSALILASILLTSVATNAQSPNPIPAPTPAIGAGVYHPWNWEIGVRNSDLSAYYQAANINYNRYHNGPARGVEVFLLQRRPKHTFSRLALGFGQSNRNLRDDGNLQLNNPSGSISTFHVSALTAEAAYGIEFPQIQKPLLNRLRWRAGMSLALQALQYQAFRWSAYNADGDYAYLHDLSSGGSMFKSSVFIQAEFRIASQIFVGLEWRYGPSLYLNNHFTRFERLVADDDGYRFDRNDTYNRGAQFRFGNPIGIPVFILGLSL